MVEQEKVYVGTKLKFFIEISSPGFSIEDDNFTVDIIRGNNVIHFEKHELDFTDEGFFLCFDTSKLGVGIISAKVVAYVPDSDFDDGIRTEVVRVDLAKVYA